MHSQVCAEAQPGTGTGFINKPNNRRRCQWPLRCGLGSAGKADVYPEETNKALSCQLGGESAQNSIIREKRRSDHVSEGRWPPRCIHTSIRDHQAAVCSRLTTCFYFFLSCNPMTERTNVRWPKRVKTQPFYINGLLLISSVLATAVIAPVHKSKWKALRVDIPLCFTWLSKWLLLPTHTLNISLFHSSHVHTIKLKERCI